MKEIKNWSPENFTLEKTSIWSFPDRGSWATHDGNYPGNWSPYVPRNLILKYSEEGDLILDQFVGGGTTLIEAKLLNRNCIGVDVNIKSLERCQEKTDFEYSNSGSVYLRHRDARDLDFIPNEGIDFICTHPPYADIIKYSRDNVHDLSLLSYRDFILELTAVAKEAFRVLKFGKYCAVLIGDIRKKGMIIPLGFHTIQAFCSSGFSLKEVIIKEQHNMRGTGKWWGKNRDFYLLAHENLYVFQKVEECRYD